LAASSPARNPAERWLLLASAAVVGIAVLSALVNRRIDLSWGWVFRFCVGVGWAILIVRTFSVPMVRRAVIGLMIVALVALVLTIAHRADRQLAYFTWPIGPITPTAALAGLWAAIAAAAVATHLWQRRLGVDTAFFALTCVVAVYVLQQTGRRGPALSLVAAVVLAVLVLVRSRFRGKAAGALSVTVVVLGVAAAGWYCYGQIHSPNHEASGAVALRLEYWKLAWGLITHHLFLGTGPDTFFVEMTNAVAPLRAVSPHVYHGNINLYAHNEWIQSAVEMGLPGALFYVAIPIGVIYLAWRHLVAPESATQDSEGGRQNGSRREARGLIVVLMAGIAAILIAESSGITLRTPMMPIWFWTLLGMLTALCGPTLLAPSRAPVLVPVPVRAIAAAGVAALCFAVSYWDMSHALVRSNPFVLLPTDRYERLYADKTIAGRQQAAVYTSALAKVKSDKALQADALRRWRDLYELIPSFRDTPARYAKALLLEGDKKGAREVIKKAIGLTLDRYQPAANALWATEFRKQEPGLQLRSVQRALRNGPLSEPLKEILLSIRDAKGNTKEARRAKLTLRQELPDARKITAAKKPPTKTETLVEVLRAGAFLEFQEAIKERKNAKEGSKERANADKLLATAISDQRLAAEYYEFLEKTNNPYRRGHRAETDAFFTLAKMLYNADRANYKEAYQAIVKAERYAVLGIKHEYVAHPDEKKQGFIVGVVIPTEFPRRLYPLWRLSALLHVEAGHEDLLVARVMSFLPPKRRNKKGISHALASIYRRAFQDLRDLPSDKRPDHYEALLAKARRYAGAASAGSGS